MSKLPTIEASNKWLARAERVIPCATQTLAKGPTQYVRGVAPVFAARGEGAYLWDVDGNRFLDFNMGIGPLVLGYAYPAVDAAIRKQLGSGITFSLMHPLEVEVAEMLGDIIPNAEAVRFSKTGADVASAAVRLARAYTGRTKIACCGYHGWHDWYIGTTPRKGGVPKEIAALTRTFKYNDLDSLKAVVDSDTAAVILEPMLFEAPTNDFLRGVRELCRQRGALLIFDEMWTGFRLAEGGAQEWFDVKADLAIFSKAIANGMPLSAITGPREILRLLDEEVFFFTTFGGEALSLAAAKATLLEITEKDVTGTMRRRGGPFVQRIQEAADHEGLGFLRVTGEPCRSMLAIGNSSEDPMIVKSFLQQELIRRGVLWSGQQVLSYSHTEQDLDRAAEAFEDSFRELAKAMEDGGVAKALRGAPVQPAFRTTTAR